MNRDHDSRMARHAENYRSGADAFRRAYRQHHQPVSTRRALAGFGAVLAVCVVCAWLLSTGV